MMKNVTDLNTFKKLYESIDSRTYYHGSPSGELVGSKSGIHIGTYKAATQALQARIGVPAEGVWDGTRKYGETLLAGRKTLRKKSIDFGYGCETGYNCGKDIPEEDYYISQRSSKAKYSDGEIVSPDSMPTIFEVAIIGRMSNSIGNPMSDVRANSTMTAMISRGVAKSGYYYINDGEDYGSISAVVPDKSFIEIKNIHGKSFNTVNENYGKLFGDEDYDIILKAWNDYYEMDCEDDLNLYISEVETLMKKGGKIYRAIQVNSPDEINFNNLGKHWTTSLKWIYGIIDNNITKDEFNSGGKVFIVEAITPPNNINIRFGDIIENPYEKEVNPINIKKLKITNVYENTEEELIPVEYGN